MSDSHAWEMAAEIAEAAMNGGHLLGDFSTLTPDSATLVDVDMAHLNCMAWVVGRDRQGMGWQAKVELEQSPIGSWLAMGGFSACDWDGWLFVADAEKAGWPAPVIALGIESTRTSRASIGSSAATCVCGVARKDVSAIEVKLGDQVRLKTISSMSGGFLVEIPMFDRELSPSLRAILSDGQTVRVS